MASRKAPHVLRSSTTVLLMLTVLLSSVVHVIELDLHIRPTWEPLILPSLKKPTARTVDPPDPLARRPLRSYIPPNAHILETGKDIEYLIRLSLWKGNSELCALLHMFEYAQQGLDQRAKVMSEWHQHLYPFRNNSVIGDILLDLNATLANTTEAAVAPVHVVLVVEIYCQDLFNSKISGTGNWLWALYAMRLWVLVASRSGNIQVDFLFDCHDAADRQSELVYPWLTGYFSSAWIYEIVPEDDCHDKSKPIGNQRQTTASQFEEMRQIVHQVKSFMDVCHGMTISLPVMLPFVRYELRRMAAALVGMPEKRHSGSGTHNTLTLLPMQVQGEREENEYYPPQTLLKPLGFNKSSATPPAVLLKDVELDDVAIHFRCGDLMQIRCCDYGFMKFSSFANRIQNTSAPFSIGIVTQPFAPAENTVHRPADHGDGVDHLCYVTAHAFVDYLQARFPQARIRIRNGPDETVALAYARLVVANQAFSPISTFSTFPVLSAMGRGYIRHPPPKADPLGLVTPPLPRNFLYDVTTSDSNGLRAVSITNSTMAQVELMVDPDILRVQKVWEIRHASERNTTVEETLINWFAS
jgi:hypothetical protein